MGKLKLIVSAIVAVGLATILVWLHFSNESLRQDNDGLKQSLAALKQLSETSAPVTTGETMGEEQRAELLQLRAEATQLRTQTNQIEVLTEANQKLKDSLKEARTASARTTGSKKQLKPEDALPQDIHPKESWAYRGYGTPDATIESTCWALVNGDAEAALKAFAPDLLPKMAKQLEGKDFAEEVKKMNMAEFRILDRQQLSPDEMVLTIYTARQDENGNKIGNSQEQTVFQRINGEWKVTEKPPPEN
jgi:uncharacterized protein YchJ